MPRGVEPGTSWARAMIMPTAAPAILRRPWWWGCKRQNPDPSLWDPLFRKLCHFTKRRRVCESGFASPSRSRCFAKKKYIRFHHSIKIYRMKSSISSSLLLPYKKLYSGMGRNSLDRSAATSHLGRVFENEPNGSRCFVDSSNWDVSAHPLIKSSSEFWCSKFLQLSSEVDLSKYSSFRFSKNFAQLWKTKKKYGFIITFKFYDLQN